MTPVLLVLALGLIWSFTFSITKAAVGLGADPIGYAWWVALGGGLGLIAALAIAGRRPGLDRRFLLYCLFMGGAGLAVPNVIAYRVLGEVPVGVFAVLTTLTPLMTYFFAVTARVERFLPVRFLGVLVGLAGALVLVLPAASLPDPAMAGWVAFGVLTPTLYALTNVLGLKFRPAASDGLVLAAGMQVAGMLWLTPAVLLGGGGLALGAGPDWTLEGIVLAHCALTGTAYVLYFQLQRSGAAFLGLIGYSVTVGGIAWGTTLYGERYSAWVWLAVALVFVALALVNLGGRWGSRNHSLGETT